MVLEKWLDSILKKCLQSDVGEVWGQKELILAWLVQSQVS